MTALDAPDTGRRVVRGGAARAAGYGATMVLGAAASVFLLRHLGVVEFGRYALVMSMIGIVSGITEAGLTAIVTRELSTRAPGAERRRMIAHLVGLRLAITPVAIGLVVAFAVVAGYPSEVLAGTAIAGAGLLLINAQASMALPLSVDLRNIRLTVVEVTKQAVGTAGIAALALGGASLVPFFGVQVLIGVAILALTPVLVGRGAMVAPRYDRAAWRGLIVQALPLATAFVLGHAYFRVVMVLVSLLAAARETGYFAASFRVFEFMVSLPLLLAGVGLPVISAAAGHDQVRFLYVLRRMSEVGFLCGIVLALTVAIAAEPALVLLGGEEYRPAAPVLRLQGLAMVGIFVSQAAIAGLVALRAQRAVVLVAGSGIVSAIALGLVLVPLLGAEGGALAVAIADTALAAVALALLRRRGVSGLLPVGFTVRSAIATAVGALPVLVPGLPALAAAVLAALLFAAAAHRLGIVPPEVLQALARRSSAST